MGPQSKFRQSAHGAVIPFVCGFLMSDQVRSIHVHMVYNFAGANREEFVSAVI
jgi:hypothetical protein